MTTSFFVHPETLGKTANALNEGSTSLDVPALNSCDVSMFSSLAGDAARVAEPSAGQSANHLLAAFGNTGIRLGKDIQASGEQYHLTETQASHAARMITKALEER